MEGHLWQDGIPHVGEYLDRWFCSLCLLGVNLRTIKLFIAKLLGGPPPAPALFLLQKLDLNVESHFF